MARRAHCGGIGALFGSAMSRMFHPGKQIRERWPAKSRHCVIGFRITGEGQRRVGQRMQMCYLISIPEFGDEVVFHIVKKNFWIDVAPEKCLRVR